MALFDLSRAVWGGGPRPRPLTAVSHPYVEVHHTGVAAHATRDPLAVMREVEQYHMSRGWNGFFYGLMLARDGRIIEGRGIGWRSIGSHNPTYRDGSRVDPRALTVVLPGDYRSVTVTDGQVKALHKVRASVPDPILRVHGDRDSTACPGTHARHAVQLLNLDTSTPPTTRGGWLMALTDDQQKDLYRMVQDLNHEIIAATATSSPRLKGWVRAEIRASRDSILSQLPKDRPVTVAELVQVVEDAVAPVLAAIDGLEIEGAENGSWSSAAALVREIAEALEGRG